MGLCGVSSDIPGKICGKSNESHLGGSSVRDNFKQGIRERAAPTAAKLL